MKTFLIALFLILGTVTATAQDFRFKVGVFATASEVKGLAPGNFGTEGTTYRPNIAAEAMGTVGKIGPVRASAGVTYKRNFTTDVDTYYLNGQVSYHYSIFEPFARFSAGLDRANGSGVFSREVLIGGDLNFGNFYVRPLAIGFKRTGEFLAPAERTFQSGLGFRF
jgi:hypothetical protein